MCAVNVRKLITLHVLSFRKKHSRESNMDCDCEKARDELQQRIFLSSQYVGLYILSFFLTRVFVLSVFRVS